MSKTLAFYKPFDVISSFTGEAGQVTLKSYIPVSGVYAAGRLDQDSEGLMLLSDNGALIHRLTDPRHHLPKTYLAQVEGLITPEALAQLQNGVTIAGGYHTRRCQACVIPEPDLPPRPKPITPHASPSWVRIILVEGKKRQVRHMTAAVGFPALRLVRVAIGPVSLGTLEPGQWRELDARELDALESGGRDSWFGGVRF